MRARKKKENNNNAINNKNKHINNNNNYNNNNDNNLTIHIAPGYGSGQRKWEGLRERSDMQRPCSLGELFSSFTIITRVKCV